MRSKPTHEATSNRDFEITLTFERTPEQVFVAITNVRGWWSEGLDGHSAKPGDVFTYRHGSQHESKHLVTRAEPGKLVTWDTIDANLSYAKHSREWIGTEVRFEINRVENQTRLQFIHAGLRPDFDCFEACSKGWAFYVGVSLKELISVGQGRPDSKGTARERVA